MGDAAEEEDDAEGGDDTLVDTEDATAETEAEALAGSGWRGGRRRRSRERQRRRRGARIMTAIASMRGADRYVVFRQPGGAQQVAVHPRAIRRANGESIEYTHRLAPVDGFDAAVRAFVAEGGAART